jgi:hypothetical protein
VALVGQREATGVPQHVRVREPHLERIHEDAVVRRADLIRPNPVNTDPKNGAAAAQTRRAIVPSVPAVPPTALARGVSLQDRHNWK